MKKVALFLSLSLIVFCSVFAQDISQATMYVKQGQYARAADEFQGVLPLLVEQYGSKDTVYFSKVLFYAAKANISCNRLDKAAFMLEKCAEIFEEQSYTNSPQYFAVLSKQAALFKSKGEYEKALSKYDILITLLEKLQKQTSEAYLAAVNNQALLYKQLGQYDKSMSLNQVAVAQTALVYGKNDSEYAVCLNNIAGLCECLGQYDRALMMYEKVLAIADTPEGRELSSFGTYLNNLAMLYERIGNNEKALSLYQASIDHCLQIQGTLNYSYIIRNANIASLYLLMQEYDNALQHANEAVEVAAVVLGKNHEEYGRCVADLAAVYDAMNNVTEATSYYREAVKNDLNNANRFFLGMSENEKERYLTMIQRHFDDYKSYFYHRYTDDQSLAGDAYNLELATKGMILQSGIKMRQTILNSGDETALKLYDEWVTIRVLYAYQAGLPLEMRDASWQELESSTEELEQQLMKLSSRFDASKKLSSTTWEEVKASLKPQEIAVEYMSFNYGSGQGKDTVLYTAILIDPSAEYPRLIPLCSERSLDTIINNVSSNPAALNSMYRGIKFGKKKEGPKEYGKQLYSLIWKPLDTFLQQGNMVYFSPTGLLHKVAFAAIPMPDKKRVSDRYALMQLSSTSALLAMTATAHQPEDITLFGGVDYDANMPQNKAVSTFNEEHYSRALPKQLVDGTIVWNYLPGTLSEVNSIDELASIEQVPNTLFIGKDATEEMFKALSGTHSPTLIHVATHGFFFPDIDKGVYDKDLMFKQEQIANNPLNRSGLLFAGANGVIYKTDLEQAADDGVLTALEATNLTLSSTQLIVLSACETGLGDIKGSEGVFGLQRAFKAAGVQYIIMSLWKVPDSETAEFMQQFYTHLFAGKSIPDSFRSAQQFMKAKYPDNAYSWAAFVLVR